jgi:hypothetical protein
MVLGGGDNARPRRGNGNDVRGREREGEPQCCVGSRSRPGRLKDRPLLSEGRARCAGLSAGEKKALGGRYPGPSVDQVTNVGSDQMAEATVSLAQFLSFDISVPLEMFRISLGARWLSSKSNMPLSLPDFTSVESPPMRPRLQLSSMKRRMEAWSVAR